MNWKHEFKNTLVDLDTPSLFESLNSYLWGIELLTIVVCFFLCLKASNLLSRDEYLSALFAFSASMIVGISPYLATMFFYQ